MARPRGVPPRRPVRSDNNGGGMSVAAAREIGELKARQDSVERAIVTIQESVSSLHVKFDARNATPWGAVGAGIAGIALLGGIIIWALSTYVGAISDGLMRTQGLIERLADTTVSREVYQQRWDAFETERDNTRATNNARTVRIEEDIKGVQTYLQDHTYPREVHQERWSAFTAELNDVRDDVQRVEAQQAAIYPTGNTINDILERIERLETRRMDPSPSSLDR